MEIADSDVIFDGADEMQKPNSDGDHEYYGLFRGHIPTTKHQIEPLVSLFYNAIQTNSLQRQMRARSTLSAQPMLEIRELYETDQNDVPFLENFQAESNF